MLVSTAQRRELLSSLQLPGMVRFGSVPVEPVRYLSTGVPALDAVLGGGLPRGGLSEISGPRSSGRTALMCALLASATRQAEVAAVVDLPDALHPETLETVGADLHRILWVRPPSVKTGLKCTDLILGAGGFGLVVLDLTAAIMSRFPLHVWPRLIRITKQSQAATVVVSSERVTGSFATVSLMLRRQQLRWGRVPTMMDELRSCLTVMRSKRHFIGEEVELAMSNSVIPAKAGIQADDDLIINSGDTKRRLKRDAKSSDLVAETNSLDPGFRRDDGGARSDTSTHRSSLIAHR